MNVLEARARLHRYAFPVPDALMAVILAAAAFGWIAATEELGWTIFVEGGFLYAEAMLVDVATRLRKRPPVWAVVLIGIAILLVSGTGHGILRTAWGKGMAVFIPLLVSFAERAAVLWHMPVRTRVQKIAARALVSNRITTALGCLAVFAAALIASMSFVELYDFLAGPRLLFGIGAIYFAVAALDEWRVRGRRFAERPSVLFRFDPLGHTYLEPV